MKIIFLAPGLARVKHGTERFFLELAGELRKSALAATCWGTSEAAGVEAIPIPSRIELAHFAKDHLQRVPDLPPAPATALQTWALDTEDQLFAIPAALLVHTDYFYAPIDAILWNAGACFSHARPVAHHATASTRRLTRRNRRTSHVHRRRSVSRRSLAS